eukprot:Hpha_TRINITY_DN32447_c0_g1::TRINITY_DN32447_c0_g1_i1::g.30809::m.30809
MATKRNAFEMMMSQASQRPADSSCPPKRRREPEAEAPRKKGAWKAHKLFNQSYEMWSEKKNLQRNGGKLVGDHANVTEYVKAQAVLRGLKGVQAMGKTDVIDP